MIKEEKFDDLKSLNEFKDKADNKVGKVINIFPYTYPYDTGLPLPRGGSFITTREGYKMLYEEKD